MRNFFALLGVLAVVVVLGSAIPQEKPLDSEGGAYYILTKTEWLALNLQARHSIPTWSNKGFTVDFLSSGNRIIIDCFYKKAKEVAVRKMVELLRTIVDNHRKVRRWHWLKVEVNLKEI